MDFARRPTVALADYRGPDPTGVPAALANADLVKRGEYLAQAADCVACHTAPGGAAFAGGLAFKLPFGTLYSTNITADKDTGIGSYSDADFLNARAAGHPQGRRAALPGHALHRPTPIMTDADVLAIKAYLFSLPAVHDAEPRQTRWHFPSISAGR